MDAPAPSPWHAPPPWLAAQLLATLLRSEPRWPLIVAELRLVSRGFRDAVGEALPGLALPRYLPASTAAAVAACFPGLRVLCLDTPGEACGGRAVFLTANGFDNSSLHHLECSGGCDGPRGQLASSGGCARLHLRQLHRPAAPHPARLVPA